MKLQEEEYKNVFNSSGARGFFGEGYWFHKLWKHFGLSYNGCEFVSKTITLLPRIGNIRSNELIPSCIKVKPFDGIVLNAVGLTNPGAYYITDKWKENNNRKVVHSFMSVGKTKEERFNEIAEYVELMDFVDKKKDALQINFSCPNVRSKSNIDEIIYSLDIARKLPIPLMAKVSAIFPIEMVLEMSKYCDAIVISNTIPFGMLSNDIDWNKIFGEKSPLEHLGGGGISGSALFPIVKKYVSTLRNVGMEKPIIAGGGILSKQNAKDMFNVGASAIELGCVSILRPWRVQSIIDYVNSL